MRVRFSGLLGGFQRASCICDAELLTYCAGAWPGGDPNAIEVATSALPTGVYNQALHWMAIAHAEAYDYIHLKRYIVCYLKCNFYKEYPLL